MAFDEPSRVVALDERTHRRAQLVEVPALSGRASVNVSRLPGTGSGLTTVRTGMIPKTCARALIVPHD